MTVSREGRTAPAPAELEVAALATGFGGDEQARTIGVSEQRDFRVASSRRQFLVESAGGELRALAERRAQHFQCLAVRDEDERFLARLTPARRLRQQPEKAQRSPASITSACWRSACSSGPSTALSAVAQRHAKRVVASLALAGDASRWLQRFRVTSLAFRFRTRRSRLGA